MVQLILFLWPCNAPTHAMSTEEPWTSKMQLLVWVSTWTFHSSAKLSEMVPNVGQIMQKAETIVQQSYMIP